jgi:hypothetical protein
MASKVRRVLKRVVCMFSNHVHNMVRWRLRCASLWTGLDDVLLQEYTRFKRKILENMIYIADQEQLYKMKSLSYRDIPG